MPDSPLWNPKLYEALQNARHSLAPWNQYYEGNQPLAFISKELLAELDGRIRPLVLNWPELVVDSLDERLDVEGFRYGADTDADQSLWDIWQANALDEASQQAHLEALIHGRAFVICGTRDGSPTPRITVESPLQVTADWDPQTREVRAALKSWVDGDKEYATLYQPDLTVGFWRDKGSTGSSWELMNEDEHQLGTVPVVPVVNRGRMLNPGGRSEIASIAPLADAACKIATDMMVGAEYHALPRRWVFGLKDSDFVDKDGKRLNKWAQLTGRVWANENENVKAGQFDPADLSNFHATINLLAGQVAAMTGNPPSALGLTTSNPASADAIRSAEARLVKRAERRQRSFGGSWEDVMRLAVRLSTGTDLPESANSLETLWADASTPTVAQKADAAVKLTAAGIIPIEQAQEDLGYTTTQRERMKQMRESDLSNALNGDMAALLGVKPTLPPPTPTAPPAG